MKKIKYSIFGMVLAAVGLSGCQTSYDAPTLEVPQATMTPNATIAEIKQLIYESVDPAEADEDIRFLLGQNPEGKDYVIHGRVISSDASGNMYQNLVIQDETAAIALAIRESSMWTSYRVGQEVVLNVTGLYIGTNACYYEVGWLDDYIGEPSLSFMSWFMFQEHSQKNGLPPVVPEGEEMFEYVTMSGPWPADKPYIVVTSIEEILSLSNYSEAGYKAMSQLVEIQNVHFVEGGKEDFAQYQESNEYRWIEDEEGNKLPLNNSGYSTFHGEILPTGTGNIRAILSYYQFSDFTSTKWQLTLRDIDDVLFNMPGSETKPYTVAQSMAMNNNGREVWTNGYIVGCVKSGVQTVTSNSDVAFGSAAAYETNNNVLIADSKDETDWTKCMIVDLPANSLIREYVNLLDNPQNIGLLLNVRGILNPYLGMHGIMGCTGANFALEGQYVPGSENNPFTVDYILEHPEDQSGKWVEGYIVGYLESGLSFENGAVFEMPNPYADYGNDNIIISSVPANMADKSNSIPVNCATYRQLGLFTSPGNFGKKVKIYGNITGVYDVTGINSVSKAEVEE